MERITVHNVDGEFAGWFDGDKAEWIHSGTRWNGENVISCATGSQWVDEYLVRTAGGRWVIYRDASRYHDGRRSARYVTEDEAREWAVRAEADESEISQHFPALPEEVQYGRPEVGPQVVVRMGTDMRDAIDARAAEAGVTRAQWMRDALSAALT